MSSILRGESTAARVHAMSGGDAVQDRTVRIVSSDAEFSRQMNDLLKQAGWSIQWSFVADCAEGCGGGVRPGWLVLDLRCEEDWERFQSLADGAGDGGLRWSTPMLGIVGRGLPISHTVLADRWLTAALPWPLPPAEAAQILEQTVQAKRQLPARQADDCRWIQAGPITFLSYTPALFAVIDDLAIAARRHYNVLLTGETGTGKTTLARIIHELSPRRNQPFLTVSCGALPSDLMGSELFGHVKGAFTGADKAKPGKFEVANGGTIVLEEIDTLDLIQQAKLLRVIETGEFERVGSNDTQVADVRIIAAANVDLESLVAANRFRADLYFRLKQLTFDLPPLRRRPADIAWLTTALVEECRRENDLDVRYIHPEFLELLRAYSWPGNIRDLRNEVYRAALFCRDGVLKPECLSPGMLRDARQAREEAKRGLPTVGLADDVAQAEIEAIERMLRATDFNRAATARALGISRVTLYNKIRKYQIRLDGPRRPK